MESEMNFYTSRILFQKDSSYRRQFSTKVRAPSRLVSEVWIKYRYIPTKILKRDSKKKKQKKTQVNKT